MKGFESSGIFRRRRQCVLASACAAVFPATAFAADIHAAIGRVDPPRQAPALPMRNHEGAEQGLRALLEGKVSAVQIMFTGCSSICPVQGALFAAVEAALVSPAMQGVQLLSISIDPLGDTPAELRGWRRKFSAGPRWNAAVPADRDLPQLLAWLGGKPPASLDRHTTQVYVVDRAAQLCWRSRDLPSAREVLAALQARAGPEMLQPKS